MNNEYYILENGQRLGPYTDEELMERPLEPGDIILRPLQTQGEPAYSLPEFDEYFKSEGIYYPTPQNTSGYILRLPAYIIDGIIIAVGAEIVFSLLIPQYMARLQSIFTPQFLSDPNLVQNLQKHQTELISIQLVIFVITVIYNSFCESSSLRASVGKYVFGLAVVDELGYSLSFGQAFKRNAGKIIYELGAFIISFVAYLMYLRMIWSVRHQAIHDQFSGCFVVKKNK